MATESLLNFLVNKLGEMVIDEAQLQLGIGNDIVFLQNEFSGLKAFIQKSDRMRNHDEVARELVIQVRNEFFKVEDILEEFLFQMKIIRSKRPTSCLDFKVCIHYIPFLFKQLTLQRRFHYQVENIKKEVGEIIKRQKMFLQQFEAGREGLIHDEGTFDPSCMSSAFMEERDLVGIEEHVKTLVDMVLEEDEKVGGTNKIISIVGMGGVGKTTLARKVYHTVRNKFQSSAWITVSQAFNHKDILACIKQEVVHCSADTTSTTINSLQKDIREHLGGKRYILILDDIWDLKAWEFIKVALPMESHGCKVIFTTRNAKVAKPIREEYFIYKLDKLPYQCAYHLFCREAFRNYDPPRICPSYLRDVVDRMVIKCDGLPLALITLGALMSKQGCTMLEWVNILENLSWEMGNDPHLERMKTLLLTSYNYLPSQMKNCFLHCCMFSEDYKFNSSDVIRMWVAEGFVVSEGRKTAEEVGAAHLLELLERNMVQLISSSMVNDSTVFAYRVHDITREVGIHVIEKEQFAVSMNNWHDDNNDCISSDIPNINSDKFTNGLKLVRVLNLQNLIMPKLPKAVGELVHLRYLAIGGLTQDPHLPTSMKNLHNLQTLQLGGKGGLRYEIPSQLTWINKLRHFINNQYEPITMPNGIKRLSHLQTLTMVEFRDLDVLRELQYLTQLKELKIKNVQGGDYFEEVCKCINKLQQLRCLYIHFQCPRDDDGQEMRKVINLKLQNLSPPPPYLRTLFLCKGVYELPKWLASHSCLQIIKLYYCEFINNSDDIEEMKEDPLSFFALNPNLAFLQFYKCKGIKKMCIGGKAEEFPKLRRLEILDMLELEELESEICKGSLKNLREMRIWGCPSLKSLPNGIHLLTNLQVLEVLGMPETFVDRYRKGGADHWMLQHIPSLNLRSIQEEE